MTPEQARNSRMAIQIMTAWLSDPDGATPFVTAQLRELVESGEDDFAAALNLIFGFVNISGHLLVRRYKETGILEAATLQELAIQYAAEE